MSLPLGLRNNNPGNIEFGAFAKRQGATRAGDGGRFAYFPDMATGCKALAALLIVYGDLPLSDRIDTIPEIVHRWAPAADNNDERAYVDFICHVCELEPTDHISLRDHDTLYWLVCAIGEHENGPDAFLYNVKDSDIDAGVHMALGL
jgi:hypothetical protein